MQRIRKSVIAGGIALALVTGVQVAFLATPAVAATNFTVTTTDDTAANAGACGNTSTVTAPAPPVHLSLREAVCLANNNHASGPVTITIPVGNYVLTNGQLMVGMFAGQKVTLDGAGSATTIISGGGSSRVLDFDDPLVGGISGTVNGLTITGGNESTFGGAGITAGSANAATADTLTVTNSVITSNAANTAAPSTTNIPGGGIGFQGGALSISNSVISNNSSGSSHGAGVDYEAEGYAPAEALTISNTIFSANTMTSSGGLNNGGALYVAAPPSVPMQVSGSTFTNNSVVASGSSGASGAGIYQESGTLAVSESTFTGNSVTGGGPQVGGAIADVAGATTLHYNRFTGNVADAGRALFVGPGAGAVNATDNWWGCNGVPSAPGCDGVVADPPASATVSPQLMFTAAAGSPAVTGPNATTSVTGSFTTDSSGAAVSGANLSAFNNTSVSFTNPQPDHATVSSSSAAIATDTGTASVTYNSQSSSGPGGVVVAFDNALIDVPITVNRPPTVTENPINQSVSAGGLASFTATASGYPAPTVQWQISTDGGTSYSNIPGATSTTYSFTAASGDDGNRYHAVFTNNVNSATSSSALLTVTTPPAFTSGAAATFKVGTPGSFTVTTSGKPQITSIAESGTLPNGLTYTDKHDGTASIGGTPDPGTGNTYPITLTATNGVAPDKTQNFTIQVNQAPAITASPSSQTVNPGASVTFTATASGVPTPTVQWQRSTNGGTSYSDIPGATSTSYQFTTTASDNGNLYHAVFMNVAGTATTTAATLNVGTAPAFTSNNSTTFTVGTAGSFAVTTSGVPDAVLSMTDPTPSWLTFTDNGHGAGSLSGQPPIGAGGTYSFTLHATNGFSPAASQMFTLRVNEAPTITSADHATFTVGSVGLFSVTTSAGYPTSTAITETGALPSGVSLTDNTNGTATLTGKPDHGTGGSYAITIHANATGGTTSPTNQTFTLIVTAPPQIISANNTTFTVGTGGSFTVTTNAGNPTATTITQTGTLPSGVTFVDNGHGTATLAGNPGPDAGGSYPLTITASNGVDPDATQSFTLTVDQAPAIISPDHTTFTIGTDGSFTVATTGYPDSSITEVGALPGGVTLTDNGDGTATLAGTPTTGSNGTYPFTITADNGVGTADMQLFTLTVVKSAQAITITSTPPANPVVGGTYTPAATASSGLTVGFSIDAATTNSACSLSGGTVHFDHAGRCVIDADQGGDSTYQAASQAQQTLAIAEIGTAVGVVSSVNPSVFGQAAHVTVTITADGGTPAGSVQFTVDGNNLGAPVTVSGGQAISPDLTDTSGRPLAPGSHPVVATFTATDASEFAGSSDSVTQVVDKAATTTVIAVHSTEITATVTAVSPGVGTPSGSVDFSVGGVSVGTATLVNGVATLHHSVPAGQTRQVGAAYGGDIDFTGSSDSTARNDPTITAHVTSAHAKTKYGWYRAPVTITFTCTTNGAPLSKPCPSAVHLSHNGAAQSVTRTITATNGGMDTVVVSHINIDHTKPHVRVKGVHNGATYNTAPKLECVGRDRMSGIATCKLTKHTHGHTTTYRATATDKAGNKRTVKGKFHT